MMLTGNRSSGKPKKAEKKLSPRRRLADSLQKTYDRFVRIRGNPREIALGFALGLFIGMSPTLGFQMAIAVFAAALLKWNKIAAAAGVWISNPLTAPIIYGLTYYIGATFLSYDLNHGLPSEPNLEAVIRVMKQAPEIIWIMTVGGIIIGFPLSVVGYYGAFSAVTRYRDQIREKLAKEKELLLITKDNIKKKIQEKKRKQKPKRKKKRR